MTYRLGVDVGGTFTDLVLVGPDGRALTRKVLSSTGDYAEAIVRGASELMAAAGIGAADLGELIHGTTVATNAILERRGARTGLLTTAGFRDLLEIGRLRLARLYDIDFERPAPLVPRRWRREVTERLGPGGGGPDAARAGERPGGRRPPHARGRRVDRDRVPPRVRERRSRAGGGGDRPRRGAGRHADALLRDPARGARVRADEHGGHQRLRHAGHGAATSGASRRSCGGSASARRSWSCSRTAGS